VPTIDQPLPRASATRGPGREVPSTESPSPFRALRPMQFPTSGGIIDSTMTVGKKRGSDAAGHRMLDGIRVLIMHGHRLFAQAIGWTLEQRGASAVWVTRDPDHALEIADRDRPDVVLVDLELQQANGLRVGKSILRTVPEAKVLAITAIRDPSIVRTALHAGFHGSLAKDTPIVEFADAIAAALGGQVVFPGQYSGTAGSTHSDHRQAAMQSASLSAREREILGLLVDGVESRQIARRLSIAPNTLRSHVQNILTKLGAHSRLEAAALAVQYGLVALQPRDGRRSAPRSVPGTGRRHGRNDLTLDIFDASESPR
jgi:two-component system nitrate/nitrite response regulator NarL